MAWDEEYDVVVIGSGFAGLSAALQAREAGAEVLVLEKMRTPGGNSAINGGLFAAPGSPLQQEAGIEDSPELLLADMLAAGMELNYRELAAPVCEEALDAFHWTLSLGVRWQERLAHLGGHSVPRTCIAAGGTGSTIVHCLLRHCRQRGVEVRIKSAIAQLLFHEGRAAGVEVVGQGGSGAVRRIGARLGVVLASGGFAADVAFRSLQDPRLSDRLETTNHAGATAEVLTAALEAGAMAVHLCWIQLGPWASLDEKGWGSGSLFTMLAGFPYGIMVDAKTGRRFVNEMADRRLRTDAMLQEERSPVAIVDAEGAAHATTLKQCLKRGVVRTFGSLEALAGYNGVPVEPLLQTVAEYNLGGHSGEDSAFGKPLPEDFKPLATPPWYAIHLTPKVHYCMGGLRIDSGGRVQGCNDGAIPGLYAAGEVTGGIHGGSRLGSVSLPECLVFGRRAGGSVVADNR